MTGGRLRIGAAAAALAFAGASAAEPRAPSGAPATVESVTDATCRLIDAAARSRHLPTAFLTRLIWRESSFRNNAVSRAGARGVAQFMPGTAAERGLADPFDPEQAIPEAARFLSELELQFGNLGLAAAAYNGGPARVQAWLAGTADLRQETRDYVAYVTGRTVDDWAAETKARAGPAPREPNAETCLQATAALRRPGAVAAEAPVAPWGVQLAGNYSKEVALASFARARRSYASLIGDLQPMIIGTRVLTRGRAYYRVRVPQPTRAAATQLCDRIRAVGGACVVLAS